MDAGRIIELIAIVSTAIGTVVAWRVAKGADDKAAANEQRITAIDAQMNQFFITHTFGGMGRGGGVNVGGN